MYVVIGSVWKYDAMIWQLIKRRIILRGFIINNRYKAEKRGRLAGCCHLLKNQDKSKAQTLKKKDYFCKNTTL